MKPLRSFGAFLLLATLFVTGCSANKNLNLSEVKDKVSNLTDNTVSAVMIQSNFTSGEVPLFENMVDLYEFDTEEKLGIDPELYESFIGAQKDKEDDPTQYLIFKVKKDKKDELQKKVDAYFEKLEDKEEQDNAKKLLQNRKKLEIDGLLIYYVHQNPKDVEETIRASKTPIFAMIMNLTDDNLESMIGLDPDLLEEYVIYMPMSITQSNLYMVIKPKEGKADDVKKQVQTYMEKLENNFSNYLPDQYDIIKNRKETTHGDYLIYIASTDNDRVLKAIKDCN